MSDDERIVTTAEHLRFRNAYVRVYDNDVVFPGGRFGTYLRIEPADSGRGAVTLVQSGDRVALVRTYRYPIETWEWAFPRGYPGGQDSAAAARREVFEELGLEIDRVERIGTITPDSGLLATHVDVYRASISPLPDLNPRDIDEVRGVAWVKRLDLQRRIAAGEITDAFTLAALTLDAHV